MIYAYINKNRKLCLRPGDQEGEQELKEFLQDLRQNGVEMIDIETEYRQDDQMQRYGYDRQHRQGFGFNSPMGYFPMPPDFSPMSHFFPIVWPMYYGQGGGQGGGSGGGSSGYRDNIYRSERGEYDGRENPRDTGRGDAPRR